MVQAPNIGSAFAAGLGAKSNAASMYLQGTAAGRDERRLSLEEELQPYRMTTLQQQSDMAKFQMDRATKRSKLEDEFMDMLSNEMATMRADELDAFEESTGMSIREIYEMLMPARPPFAPEGELRLPGDDDPYQSDFMGPLPGGARRYAPARQPASGQGFGVGNIGNYPMQISAPRVEPGPRPVPLAPRDELVESILDDLFGT